MTGQLAVLLTIACALGAVSGRPTVPECTGANCPSVSSVQMKCQHNGNEYRNGEEWEFRQAFIMRCTTSPGGWKTDVVACVLPNTNRRVYLNQVARDGIYEWRCEENENGVSLVQGIAGQAPGVNNVQRPNQGTGSGSRPANKCIDEQGLHRNVGETWVENNRFNKTCRSTGAVEVLNCITKDGYRVPLNGQLIRDGIKYTCEATTSGTIRYASGPV